MRDSTPVAPSRKKHGFTLIELMIVLVIISILAAIAFPSYNRYVFRTRRTDAHNLLMRIAAEQERYYTTFNRYTANLTAAPPAGLGMTQITSENNFYRATAVLGDVDQSFVITAAPQGTQLPDACASLTLGSGDQHGFTGAESNGSCW